MPASERRNLTCLGFSPFRARVIHSLVPTGLPPNIEPKSRMAERMFSRTVAGGRSGGAEPDKPVSGSLIRELDADAVAPTASGASAGTARAAAAAVGV